MQIYVIIFLIFTSGVGVLTSKTPRQFRLWRQWHVKSVTYNIYRLTYRLHKLMKEKKWHAN